MSKIIESFDAINDNGRTTVIVVYRSLDESLYADSNDLGMGHVYPNSDTESVAAELARRHGYRLFTKGETK